MLFKRELTKLPLLGRAFQIGGFVPIDRASREQSMAAIDQAAASLRAGNSFLTFPEGTRSRTGALLPFKRGPFLMALKAQVPVVPVAVQGGTASMRKGSPIVRPTTVSVRIGKPVETRGMDLSDRGTLADLVRSRVEELLALGPVGKGWEPRSENGARELLQPRGSACLQPSIACLSRFVSSRRAWRCQPR